VGSRASSAGVAGGAALVSSAGCGHQHVRAQCQGPDHLVLRQRGAGCTHAQRQVHAVLPHVDVAVGGLHVQVDQRPGVEKACQHVAHAVLQQRRWARQAHRAARSAGLLGGQRLRGRGLGQHGTRVLQRALADVGECKAPRGALDQAHAQAGFQRADAAAQLALGDAGGALGRGKAAVLGHVREVGQVVEVIHGVIRSGACGC